MSDFVGFSGLRTARKEHRCTLCGGIIKKGEKYHVNSGRFDGYFYENKLHKNCHKAVDLAYVECEWRYDEGWDSESVMDYVNDVLESQRMEIPKLKKDAIDKFFEVRNKIRGHV